MSELKSRKFIEKHGLTEKLAVNDKTGQVEPSEDFYESTLSDTGLTLDQVKKLQKHNAQLLAASTLAAGELAAEHFKEHPETKEMSFEYNAGHDVHQAYFSTTENTAGVRNVVEVHGAQDKGELKKVHKDLKSLFDTIHT